MEPLLWTWKPSSSKVWLKQRRQQYKIEQSTNDTYCWRPFKTDERCSNRCSRLLWVKAGKIPASSGPCTWVCGGKLKGQILPTMVACCLRVQTVQLSRLQAHSTYYDSTLQIIEIHGEWFETTEVTCFPFLREARNDGVVTNADHSWIWFLRSCVIVGDMTFPFWQRPSYRWSESQE